MGDVSQSWPDGLHLGLAEQLQEGLFEVSHAGSQCRSGLQGKGSTQPEESRVIGKRKELSEAIGSNRGEKEDLPRFLVRGIVVRRGQV